MSKKMVTSDGKVFHDPTDEAIANVTFAIIWGNSNYGDDHKVISSFGWRIESAPINSYLLRDPLGEVSHIRWGTYTKAIEFSSWTAFHDHNVRESLAALKKELETTKTRLAEKEEVIDQQKLRIVSFQLRLRDIYDVTHTAGPGSRRRVKAIIEEILEESPCGECGKIRCSCE